MKFFRTEFALRISLVVAGSIAALFIVRRLGFIPPPEIEAFLSANDHSLYFLMVVAMFSAAFFGYKYCQAEAKNTATSMLGGRINKAK